MANRKYSELIAKAAKSELSQREIRDMFLLMDERMNERDLQDKKRDRQISKSARSIQDIEEEYPLLPTESDELSNAVKKKGVEILGGKKSGAYKDVALRRKTYQDIYGEVKREFGLIDEKGFQMSYKKLKRKHLQGAFIVVQSYVPPSAIQADIETANEIDEIDES